jgi:hypothetical protein
MKKIYFIFAIAFASCTDSNPTRIEKKFVVDSAWHQKNPNGIPPDIEGKNWVLVNGSVFTTSKLMKKGDSISLYYYK